MSSHKEFRKCKCGNPMMVSDYNYKEETLYEFCDVCSYYHTVAITNKPKDGNYKEWEAVYQEESGIAGIVLKIFKAESDGYEFCCIKKDVIRSVVGALKKATDVVKFGITFKNKMGFYQTQIYTN